MWFRRPKFEIDQCAEISRWALTAAAMLAASITALPNSWAQTQSNPVGPAYQQLPNFNPNGNSNFAGNANATTNSSSTPSTTTQNRLPAYQQVPGSASGMPPHQQQPQRAAYPAQYYAPPAQAANRAGPYYNAPPNNRSTINNGINRASYTPNYRVAAAEQVNAAPAVSAQSMPAPGARVESMPVPHENGNFYPGGSGEYSNSGLPVPEGYGSPADWPSPGCNDCDSGCCGDYCCGQNHGCSFDFSGGYLLWWAKGDHTPPLVTTSPPGTDRTAAGVLGQDGTSILFGNTSFNNEARSGFYGTADYWLSCDRCVGIEASYLWLNQHTEGFHASSDGDPILARPFFNTTTGAQDSGLIAFPNIQTGSIDVTDVTGLQGGELLMRANWLQNCQQRIDFLVGYRFLQLRDSLRAVEADTSIDPNGIVPVGTTLDLLDNFGTLNTFNGADLGIAAQWQHCRYSLNLLMKLGLGNTQSKVAISGSTTITEPTQTPVTNSGGFLALGSNIGQFERNSFTMVPEIGATLAYDFSCHLRFTAGYTLLFWSGVARPGDQIDTNLNSALFPVPTPPTTISPPPEFRFITADYWAQGLNLGAEYRF
ncbi:MAG TPA: BBP7 family outer membrane beta-barrel protein [Pirellulales bacterium]|nr:BBP7 family outer membrane beta-barrel protein [Pirellulales bacterium]